MERLLAEQGTLYLVGSDRRNGGLGPLFSSLTGHIFEQAKPGRQPRSRRPAGPAASDGPGRGRADLPGAVAALDGRQRRPRHPTADRRPGPEPATGDLGDLGAETIRNNANAKLIFGGLSVGSDLQELVTVCGERQAASHSYAPTAHGRRVVSVTGHRLPVLAAHELRELDERQALLLYRSTPPVLVNTEAVWERYDVCRQRRRRSGPPATAVDPPLEADGAELDLRPLREAVAASGCSLRSWEQ